MSTRHEPVNRLVFYDTETTGTNLEFDQILQFAAVLVDERFNEIDRFEISCRRLPWVIPSPRAMLVTGMTPDRLDDPDLPIFPDMIAKIVEKITAWAPAIFIGYNSLRFDEPLLQRSLWQTLHPAYLTVTNGNGRADVLPVARAASYTRPHILKLPKGRSGQPVFRLDKLAPLNGFKHTNAHDALGDVEATIHIARRIASRAPDLWKAALARSNKMFVANILTSQEPILILEYLPAGRPAWWGIRIDDKGPNTSAATIARLDSNWASFHQTGKTEDRTFLSQSPRPVREISLNKAPLIFDASTAQTLLGMKPSNSEIECARWFARSKTLRDRTVLAASSCRGPRAKATALEQRIFEGFPNRSDSQLMAAFNLAPWEDRVSHIRKFGDSRFQQLAQRLVYLGAPNTLSQTDLNRVHQGIVDRLHSTHKGQNLWRTLAMARNELAELENTSRNNIALASISTWLSEIENEFQLPSE